MPNKIQTFEESVGQISKECNELMIDKLHDYKFESTSEVLDAVDDGLQRLIDSITDGQIPKNKTTEGIWVRLRNYGQFALILKEGVGNDTQFRELVKEQSRRCDELMMDKQRDYGPKNISMFGEFGVLVRMNDKIQRLLNLTAHNKDPEYEAIEDTWMDLRNYGQIALMVRYEQFVLPLEVDAIGSIC